MPKILHKVQSFIRNFDLFSYTSFLRYKGDTQFKTATGGFFSLSIIIIFAILFANLGIKMFRQQIISFSSSIMNQSQPSLTQIYFDPSSFMIVVFIDGIKMNHPTKRYFDVSITQRQIAAGLQIEGGKTINLVPCTQSHFSINTQVLTNYRNMVNKDDWLCPQLSSYFQLYGKYTGKSIKYLSIQVKKCDPTLNLTRQCALQTQILEIQRQIGSFILNFFYINPLINPGAKDYLSHYLQDRYFITFSTKLGFLSSIFLEDYTIQTDKSILPFVQLSEEQGIIIGQAPNNIFFIPNSDLYAQIILSKSSTKTLYSRAFYKVDEFFAYIGGLVGVIIAGMFLLNSYNQYSFLGELAGILYKIDQGNSSNFLQFFKIRMYSLLKRCLVNCSLLSRVKIEYQIREQMQKQLDLPYILSRINFLERAVSKIGRVGQYNFTELTQKFTLQKAKSMRKRIKHQTIHIDIQDIDNQNNIRTIQSKRKEVSSDSSQAMSKDDSIQSQYPKKQKIKGLQYSRENMQVKDKDVRIQELGTFQIFNQNMVIQANEEVEQNKIQNGLVISSKLIGKQYHSNQFQFIDI